MVGNKAKFKIPVEVIGRGALKVDPKLIVESDEFKKLVLDLQQERAEMKKVSGKKQPTITRKDISDITWNIFNNKLNQDKLLSKISEETDAFIEEGTTVQDFFTWLGTELYNNHCTHPFGGRPSKDRRQEIAEAAAVTCK